MHQETICSRQTREQNLPKLSRSGWDNT